MGGMRMITAGSTSSRKDCTYQLLFQQTQINTAREIQMHEEWCLQHFKVMWKV